MGISPLSHHIGRRAPRPPALPENIGFRKVRARSVRKVRAALILGPRSVELALQMHATISPLSHRVRKRHALVVGFEKNVGVRNAQVLFLIFGPQIPVLRDIPAEERRNVSGENF